MKDRRQSYLQSSPRVLEMEAEWLEKVNTQLSIRLPKLPRAQQVHKQACGSK